MSVEKSNIKEKGITLLETILYIALFSICFFLLTSLYSSLLLASSRILKEIRRAEIVFYSEHIVYSDIPTNDVDKEEYSLRIEQKISRILKYYPEIIFETVETCTECMGTSSVEYETPLGVRSIYHSYTAYSNNTTFNNTVSDKNTMFNNNTIQVRLKFNSFSHTVYINLI